MTSGRKKRTRPWAKTLSMGPMANRISTGEARVRGHAVSVPESPTWAMFMIGFAGLAFVGYWSRKAIDAKIFEFVAEIARSDFPQSGFNAHRLSQYVTQMLLHKASLPKREIEDAAYAAESDAGGRQFRARRPAQ